MLTVRETSENRVGRLECGADDYLVESVIPVELVTLVHALLPRVAIDELT